MCRVHWSLCLIHHPDEVVVCSRDNLGEESKVFSSHYWLSFLYVANSKHLCSHLLEMHMEILAIDCNREERMIFVEEVNSRSAPLNRCLCNNHLLEKPREYNVFSVSQMHESSHILNSPLDLELNQCVPQLVVTCMQVSFESIGRC